MKGKWIFAAPLPFFGVPSGTRPYLHNPRPDSIWVSWWSNGDSQTFIDYGLAADQLTNTETGAVDVFSAGNAYHSGKLSGLTPNTFYYYRVRTETVTSEVFRFRTAKDLGSKSGKFRALIIGDNQITAKESSGDPYFRYEKLMERAVSKIRALHGEKPIEEIVDVVLMPGDQVDVGSVDQWRNLHFYCSRLISPNVPIMTSVGNHETYGDPGLDRYRRLFRYEEIDYASVAGGDGDSYYAHQMSNLVFVHTNSELGNNGTQTQWVRDLKDAYSTDESVDWVVSICHRPYQAEQYLGDISSWLRNTAMGILNESDKHFLNIGAHHHIYHRGQVRDQPTYHIISGGSAWDQYWGQSGREADYDDVQKSINNWAWQLMEIDHVEAKAEVVCYSEAHCLLPANQRWIYNSQEIDRFHRNRSLAAPDRPSLEDTPDGEVNLPVILKSSAFSSSAGEQLNSIQYQVATDAGYNNLKVDEIVDFENYYGDTGAPDYVPVDINAGKDITRYELGVNRLANGTYFARIRHRDRNAMWSEWSDSVSLEIGGSDVAEPSIALAKMVYGVGEAIPVVYAFGPGNATDWVGIYRKGDTPGQGAAMLWEYVSGASGQVTPTRGPNNFAAGEEAFAVFFENDGYNEISPRIPLYIGRMTELSASKSEFTESEDVSIAYAEADLPETRNRIHLYRAGDVAGAVDSLASVAIESETGQWTIPPLGKGYFYAVVQANSGNLMISEPLPFSVGDRIANLSIEEDRLTFGEDLSVTYENGPANPKDYLGIFRQGEQPGEGDLVHYQYVDGDAARTEIISADIAPGKYYVSLLTNDSYTEVSNRQNFTVVPRLIELEELSFNEDKSEASLEWDTTMGVEYVLQKSSDMKGWGDVATMTGTGKVETMRVDFGPGDQRCFYRLVVK